MEWMAAVLFLAVILVLLAGFPVAFTLGGTALVFAGIGAAAGVVIGLLTGKLVFEGRTAVALMSGHVHDAPQPLSEVCEFEVDPELEGLIMQCLEKDPARRPASPRRGRTSMPCSDRRPARADLARTHRTYTGPGPDVGASPRASGGS